MKIIANFKMNKSPLETKDYLMNFLSRVKDNLHEIVLCLPFTSLYVGKFLTEGTGVKIGAQNICDEDEGKCTGEINGSMLADAGAKYVIIGHSERRVKFKENSKIINKKIKCALKHGLNCILCVGENLVERNTLKTADVLKEQIEDALKGIYENELEHIIIAYEPIWAIGTGQHPTAKEIDISANVIRKVIANDFSAQAGEKINVVYGGSVEPKNINQVSKAKKVNGFLIGGASLDYNNLLQILSTLK